MNSGKIKKAKIKKAREEKAKKLEHEKQMELNRLPVNKDKVNYLSTMYEIPSFYIDYEFNCKDCGSKEIWTAQDQKWWHEEKEQPLEIIAVRCIECRKKVKQDKQEQKQHMEEMAKKSPHPNEAFFKNT